MSLKKSQNCMPWYFSIMKSIKFLVICAKLVTFYLIRWSERDDLCARRLICWCRKTAFSNTAVLCGAAWSLKQESEAEWKPSGPISHSQTSLAQQWCPSVVTCPSIRAWRSQVRRLWLFHDVWCRGAPPLWQMTRTWVERRHLWDATLTYTKQDCVYIWAEQPKNKKCVFATQGS